jgi:chromosome segregation ATPase
MGDLFAAANRSHHFMPIQPKEKRMPPISKETAQTLSDTIKMVKSVEAQDAKIQPQYKKMSAGLKAGIDNASEEEISLYRPQLEKVGKLIDTCLGTIQGAIGLLSQLRQDEALMEAKFDQIEKLVKSVAAKRKKLAEQSAEARKLDADAEKALAAAQKGAQSAEADLSALQAAVASFMKTIAHIDVEAPKLEAAAKKAYEKKDQKTLTDSRTGLIDFLQYKSGPDAMRRRIEKYKKQYPDITHEQVNEVQYMLDDLQRADSTMAEVDKKIKELMKLGQVKKEDKPEPPAKKAPMPAAEVAKAGKALGIQPKDYPKLAKILNELPRFKWADALSKLAVTLKLQVTNGKDLVQLLNKVESIKKAQLIDI